MPRSGIALAKIHASAPFGLDCGYKSRGACPLPPSEGAAEKHSGQRESCNIPRFDRTDAQLAPEFNLGAGRRRDLAMPPMPLGEVGWLDRQASFAGFMTSIYISNVSACAPRTRKAQHASRGGVPRPLPERQHRPAPVRERSAPNSAGEGFKTAKRARNQLGKSRRRHPLQRLMVLYATDFGCMARRSICCIGTCFFCEKDLRERYATPRSGTRAKS
jgi:hypothetical protein